MQVLKMLVLVLVIPMVLVIATVYMTFDLLAFTEESQNPIWAFSPVGYMLQTCPFIVGFLAFIGGHKIIPGKD